ncbi:MAG: hypothetical protein IPI81_00970 [Flavobacteriales bacterium]|nr:hypothetical protein [Flavobacteriales bacterium]
MRMAPITRLTILSIATVVLGAACGRGGGEDDPVVAKAFDQTLHWSDLRQVVPIGTAAEDSAAMAQAYVNNWLHKQVELHQAEIHLSSSQKHFDNELEDYRNSLLLFAYEEALVRQRLDTAISADTIAAYYRNNADNFDLKDDILRARWFRVQGLDKRTMKKLEDRFKDGRPEQMSEVEMLLAERGITITDRSDRWITLQALRNEVPLEALPSGAGDGFRTTLHMDSITWFLHILELRTRLSPSPIELVRQDIRTILLNQRKLRLIEQMRTDLYHKAVDDQQIEVY